ncbi:hypothetical protein ACIHFD_49265 [Nonomuraea sp. NPDC051941]|uniref:hypothetical protein n=1 Tax=Nonomuraea sp. NPDC051941 TaxID=3364373 RepID=UPI0037C849B9
MFGPEAGQERLKVLTAAGLSEICTLPSDEEAFFALAARVGLLVPVDAAAAEELLGLEWEDFVDVVAADIRDEHGIDGRLRDPVVAYSWGCALAELHRQTALQLGIRTSGPVSEFPVLSLNVASMDEERAWRAIRQLRFLGALRQAAVEQQRLQRDLKHVATQRANVITADATARAVDVLVERHRALYEWLLREMTVLADPDTQLMPADWRKQRGTVVAELETRLARSYATAS